jgi:3-oxoadipate enol-lactonase
MRAVEANGIRLAWREDGDPAGVPVLFANSLGTDMRLWDDLVSLLPGRLRILRYDMRGHGLSDVPAGPYTLDNLVSDTLGLLDAVENRPVIFVGLSLGGMIGQAIAAREPGRLRGLVLSNTAPRMGSPDMWNQRIAAIDEGGMQAVGDAIMERWFAPAFRASVDAAPWQAMLTRTPAEGYQGCCAALAGADLWEQTATLMMPTLAIAGDADRACPPDQVEAMAAMTEGVQVHTLHDVGHLPPVEAPRAYASVLTPFLERLSGE